MSKRTHEDIVQLIRPSKRLRLDGTDRLSQLSDELLLRVFSYVPVEGLVICQRVSRRTNAICSDSQLWKAAYYNRFVRPRAAKLPGLRGCADAFRYLKHSSRTSKWLEDDWLIKGGDKTDWQRQYRVRHNWSLGSCKMSELQLAEEPPVPPLLVRLHDGIVYTADSIAGLRAWTSKEDKILIAATSLKEHGNTVTTAPTAMSVNPQNYNNGKTSLAVGFQNGSFAIYRLDANRRMFVRRCIRAVSLNETICAIAFQGPYLLTMTDMGHLSIYIIPSHQTKLISSDIIDPPRLLHSLKSHTASQPLSLSLRLSNDLVFASVAYAYPTLFSGWTVGIQEMQMTLDGDMVQSRLASADQSYVSLSKATSHAISSQDAFRDIESPSRPSSLSYSHPYLLLAHPDNTLSLYLVNSTSSSLSICAGSRLWGHTSSISGAHVGMKGRAVSVSARGDELRVWELEGGVRNYGNRKKTSPSGLSVRIRPKRQESSPEDLELLSEAILKRGIGLDLALEQKIDDVSVTRGWIGFDEENVIVLREADRGSQALVLYNFA